MVSIRNHAEISWMVCGWSSLEVPIFFIMFICIPWDKLALDGENPRFRMNMIHIYVILQEGISPFITIDHC